MKSRLAAILAATTLTLTACGTQQNEESTPTPHASPAPTTTQSNVEPLELDKEITLTHCGGNQPCEIKVTFTKMEKTETCPEGVSFPDMKSNDPEGSIYLTIFGKYEVVSAQTNFSLEDMDFSATRDDKVAVASNEAFDCEHLDVNSDLSNPIGVGQAREGQMTLAIDNDATTLRFKPMFEPIAREIDLTQFQVKPGAGERPQGSPSQAGTAALEPQAPAPEEKQAPVRNQDSIWSEPGTGYQCTGTDAYVNDPSDCTPENLGGQPLPDNIGNPEYSGECVGPAAVCGYGVDENGNPNLSSGEIQAWWGNCIANNSAEYCRENDPYVP